MKKTRNTRTAHLYYLNVPVAGVHRQIAGAGDAPCHRQEKEPHDADGACFVHESRGMTGRESVSGAPSKYSVVPVVSDAPDAIGHREAEQLAAR